MKRRTLAWAAVASGPLLLAALLAGTLPAAASAATSHHTWYVSASAAPGGTGARSAPFGTLSAVQAASGPGDTIIVLPSALNVAPLDGGIALQPDQHLLGGGPSVLRSSHSAALTSLPRITNTSATQNSGDAVDLANGAEVANLVIDGSYRGAVYGQEVTGVNVHGNDISGQNASCTDGFLVQPFDLETYTAGVGDFDSGGVQNGWAAIMLDESYARGSVSVDGNYIHDGACGDGIDIRTFNIARINAAVEHNTITRLPQGAAQHSVLAIGMQALGTSVLRVDNAGNSETDIGSAGADCEGQFVNPAGSGTLIDQISGNVFDHGIGGASCNGFEYILSNGNATGNVHISDSRFSDDPGDMFEEFNYGAASHMALTLNHVVVKGTTLSGGTASYAMPSGTATITGNLGECLGVSQDGAKSVTSLVMRNSAFSGCDNDGIQVTNNHTTSPLNGVGSPKSISITLDHSTITGSRYYDLWVNNLTALGHLNVKIQRSDLADSASGVAVAFDQQPTGSTGEAKIDLGGGSLGSAGRNCIAGGSILDLEATGYHVSAQHDWWGVPDGPAPGTTASTPAGELSTAHPLAAPPAAC
jgi:hypothetical protein